MMMPTVTMMDRKVSDRGVAFTAADISAALDKWSGYAKAKKALLDAGVVRSLKSAEADFSEWLIARLLGGALPPSKSHPSFDVLAPGLYAWSITVAWPASHRAGAAELRSVRIV